MPRITWSAVADNDLKNIEAWLAENRSPAFELRILQKIHDRSRFLGNSPSKAPFVKGELRKLLVLGTPYIIIYRIFEDDVEILRLFHERQDWQSML